MKRTVVSKSSRTTTKKALSQFHAKMLRSIHGRELGLRFSTPNATLLDGIRKLFAKGLVTTYRYPSVRFVQNSNQHIKGHKNCCDVERTKYYYARTSQDLKALLWNMKVVSFNFTEQSPECHRHTIAKAKKMNM